MNKAQRAAVERAYSMLGDGYIYGATGWICSLKRRLQQAEQYPEFRSQIMGIGAKWDGKHCWDCAQLTKACARAGGVQFPSGATNQWMQKAIWKAKGTIDSLPADEPVFLYRRSANQKNMVMAHTGLYLGDGTFIHARGHAYGVLRQGMAEYAWTHWATPWEAGDAAGEEDNEEVAMTVLYKAAVTAASGGTVNMRSEPNGAVIRRVPVGTVVEVLSENAGWSKIAAGGQNGWMHGAYLKRVEEEPAPETAAVAERLAEIEKRVSALESTLGLTPCEACRIGE